MLVKCQNSTILFIFFFTDIANIANTEHRRFFLVRPKMSKYPEGRNRNERTRITSKMTLPRYSSRPPSPRQLDPYVRCIRRSVRDTCRGNRKFDEAAVGTSQKKHRGVPRSSPRSISRRADGQTSNGNERKREEERERETDCQTKGPKITAAVARAPFKTSPLCR